MTEPKVYRTKSPMMSWFGSLAGLPDESVWVLTKAAESAGFSLFVQKGDHLQGWVFTRQQLADLWEMLSEGLHGTEEPDGE